MTQKTYNIDFEGFPNFCELVDFAMGDNLDIYSLCHAALIKKVLISDESKLLSDFINSLENKSKIIRSQLLQDAFAEFIIGDRYSKTFLEFGATDGIHLSNSYMLENNFNWNGVLAEPSPQWHEKLKSIRPNTKILTKCIWKSSGEKLDFFVSDVGVLSTLSDFKESDISSMPGNAKTRVENGKTIKVDTISINDVMEKNFNRQAPSYISIDTEGSEYEILKSFDFEKYRPVVFTIEHNFTNLQNKIDKIMESNGYVRVFRKITEFDSWYVVNETLDIIK